MGSQVGGLLWGSHLRTVCAAGLWESGWEKAGRLAMTLTLTDCASPTFPPTPPARGWGVQPWLAATHPNRDLALKLRVLFLTRTLILHAML